MRVKSSGMAPGWQMPGPRAVQNLQNKLMPHPRDGQGGQMPRSSPGAGGGGGGGAQVEWTDALLASTNWRAVD